MDSQPYGTGFPRDDDESRTINKVGPHGFVHGWIKAGYGDTDSSAAFGHVSGDASGDLPEVAKYNAARSKAVAASIKADRADTAAAHEKAGNAHQRAAGKAVTAARAARKSGSSDLAQEMRSRVSHHSEVGGKHDVYQAELSGTSKPGPGYRSGR